MYKIAFIFGFLMYPILGSTQDTSHIILLGIAQDGGYPHLGCEATCCSTAWDHPEKQKMVISLAILDPDEKKWYLVEATPDISRQIHLLNRLTHNQYPYLPEAIFISHAHIGHYSGLLQLGREVKNTKEIPVFGLPRFCEFIKSNGPWSQLVTLNNIVLQELNANQEIKLSKRISIQAIPVPHRDEFSETAAFKISCSKKKYLFIPDIDKWEKWDQSITDVVKESDYAFLDATFYSTDELKSRNIKEVPHPTVQETMQLFKGELESIRSKIVLIHMNHTNPLLWDKTLQKQLKRQGFRLGQQGARY